jgi:ribosomal protein S8
MKKKYLYTLNVVYRGMHSSLKYSIDKSDLLDFEFLSKLRSIGIILGYFKVDTNSLLIIYNKKYQGYCIESKLSTKFKRMISLKEIFKLMKINAGFYYLILTKYGLLTHQEAYAKKIGGRLLFVISK